MKFKHLIDEFKLRIQEMDDLIEALRKLGNSSMVTTLEDLREEINSVIDSLERCG